MHAEHNDTIKMSDTVLRKIYLSLYWKGCVWEGVEDRTELQHIDPTNIYGHQRSFPVHPGLLNRGSGAKPLWVLVYSTASDLQTLNQGPEGSLCRVLAFSTASCLQLIEFPVHLVIYQFNVHLLLVGVTISHSFNPSTVKVILHYSSTRFTCYLHRCISYFDNPAGS